MLLKAIWLYVTSQCLHKRSQTPWVVCITIKWQGPGTWHFKRIFKKGHSPHYLLHKLVFYCSKYTGEEIKWGKISLYVGKMTNFMSSGWKTDLISASLARRPSRGLRWGCRSSCSRNGAAQWPEQSCMTLTTQYTGAYSILLCCCWKFCIFKLVF